MKKNLELSIGNQITIFENSLEKAKLINLENPILRSMNNTSQVVNEPEPLFYKGSKILSQDIINLKKLLIKLENEQFNFEIILDKPSYYPVNVYDREIPNESLDIYMTSPPCQAFSLAGKRLGKDDKRGILFFNSLEFIQQNKPRYFIFENVRGLLSDDGGKTFSEWVNLLGGKSVNGNTILFPYDDAAPYHLYWEVLNAKVHGIPQNRERVFLVGIRDDVDNTFRFPIEEHLTKRLKDVLEQDVDDKYFLSDNMISYLQSKQNQRPKEFSNIDKDYASTITANYSKQSTDCKYIKIGFKFKERQLDSIASSIHTREGRQTQDNYIKYEKEIIQSINQDICTGIDASYYKGFGVRQGKCRQVVKDLYRIRRLTPRECFRLMDFPDSFTWTCSDSQAYKQAGNSIVVNVLYKILKNLNLSKSTT